MIGILIFTHGKLCESLRQEAERLAGFTREQGQLIYLFVAP